MKWDIHTSSKICTDFSKQKYSDNLLTKEEILCFRVPSNIGARPGKNSIIKLHGLADTSKMIEHYICASEADTSMIMTSQTLTVQCLLRCLALTKRPGHSPFQSLPFPVFLLLAVVYQLGLQFV